MSEEDSQMLKDIGLEPSGDNRGFSDSEQTGCGCGRGNREVEAANATMCFAN